MNIKAMVQEAATRFNGEYYISKQGVPLVIIQTTENKGNLCYFGKTKIWRWFYPSWEFDTEVTRTDFDSLDSFDLFLAGQMP